jgi:hypothetical protein
MIKSFTATTREIDDVQAAVAEIILALDLEKNLLENSLGIISCFSEFEDTGVLSALSEALPFDCIGTTTCLCASDGQIDQVLLTITVLTSNDCDFKTIAIPIGENYDQTIDSVLKEQLGQSEEKPALFLSFFPLMTTVSGDMMLSAIDKATGGVPLFGTTAVDHTQDYSTAKTLRNGETFRESVVLGAIFGSPKITFEIASIDENKIRKQKAIITESNGNLISGVNDKPILEYFEEIGLSKDDIAGGLGVVPLVVDYNDGTKPVTRAVFALTPDGQVVCGGEMPVGCTLGVGAVNSEDVLMTAENTLKPLTGEECAILSYSCVARYLVLGVNNTAEAEKIDEIIGDTPYMFTYSGGEICPLPDSEGKLKNLYHNYTIVFCKLS